MSEKLNKLLSSKQIKQSIMSHSLSTAEINKSRLSSNSNFGAMSGDNFTQSKSGFYDKVEENNSKIKMNQSTELNKLL
jgi:sensor histidine kinase YesM